MDWNNLSANLTNITTTLAEKPSVATLATVLLTFTGFQDWLKLFLIGGVFETCRRVFFQVWYSVVDSLWITVDFEEGDDSYGEDLTLLAGRLIIAVMSMLTMYCSPTDWMMVWLSQHPAWVKARKLAISTSSFGLENPLDDFGNSRNGRKVRFVVAYDYMSAFWYKWRYVKAMRSKADGLSFHAARSLHLR